MNGLEAGRHSARVARSGAKDSAGYPALRAERREDILTLEVNRIPVPLAAPAIGGVDDVVAARIELDEGFHAGLGLFASRHGRERLKWDAEFTAPERAHALEERGDAGRKGERKDDRERRGHEEFSTLIFAECGPNAIRLRARQSSSSGPDSGGMGRLEGGLPKAARSHSATSGPSVTSTKTMMIRAIFIGGRQGSFAPRHRGAQGESGREPRSHTRFGNAPAPRTTPSSAI
jgi:hypothetical protein